MSVPVKRVHSRHRRFIAPGAVWDVMIGVEVIGVDYEARYNGFIRYNMDYLFGGFKSLTAAVAAATAASKASAAIKKAILNDEATTLLASEAGGKRKKRSRRVF